MHTRTAFVVILLSLASVSFADDTNPDCKDADSGRYSAIEKCGGSEFDKVNAAVDLIYGDFVKALKDDLPNQKLLIESQSAWKLSRDKTCDIWNSMMSYEVSWCRYGMTENRLQELKHMHACFTIGGGEC